MVSLMYEKKHITPASPHQIDNRFEMLLQELPNKYQSLAVEFQAFTRARQIKNVEQLLQTVLLYCGLDFSLATTAGTLTNLGSAISNQGVADRLRNCVPWLTALLGEMLPKLPRQVIGKITRLLLIDGSTVQCPGATQTDYRIHLAWDWIGQEIVDIQITDSKTGESLKLYEWQEGDVGVADRGYGKEKQVSYVLEQGGEIIVRIAPHSLRLVDEVGNDLELAKELSKAKGIVTKKVVMKSDQKKRVLYLHCFEIPREKADKSRQKKRKKAQANGKTIKREMLIYAGWTLILTSLPPEKVEVVTIGEIYRLRWQIEIVIKRLKSVLDMDKMRAKRGGELAKVYLLGKCLYILLVEKLGGKLSGGKEVAWQVWEMVKEEIRPLITESRMWKWTSETIKKISGRPRHRLRQHQKLSLILTNL